MALLPKRQRIAVVEMFGTIGSAIKSPVYERVFSNIQRSRRILAMVLDIDSPGGTVAASEYLYRSVSKVARVKPVVASIRGTGASGAYLIGCAAQRIVALPGSLVGSIGVISIRPVLEQLLQRLGVTISVNKGGELKDMWAFWRAATDEERHKIQSLVDDSYDEFITLVAQARRMDKEVVRGLATGEVYRGSKARDLGLVDELGDLDRAIDLAAELQGEAVRPARRVPG